MPIQEHSFLQLKQLADAIVAMFGRNCEVAIHDLTDLQKSLIYIAGEVTDRKIGAPATDLLVKALGRKDAEMEDMYNYKTTTKGGRAIKSSTIFLRNQNNEMVAAFCINFDTTDFFNATQALSTFINLNHTSESAIQETFASSISETIEALFDQALVEIGKQPATMTTNEKIMLTSLLEEQGVFQMKGAVNIIADLTGVSNYTIYNYLKKIRTTPPPSNKRGKGARYEEVSVHR